MDYLPIEKINLHLKRGRKLFHFIGLGEYFESKTFEYMTLFKVENEYSVKLVRALDYMYNMPPNMEEFETVDKLEECESKYSGSLAECLIWAEGSHSCSNKEWALDIIDTYLGYTEKGILGQGCEPKD